MVARLTIGKKKYSQVEAQMGEILLQADRLRRELTHAVDEDSIAFEGILSAFKLPNETETQEAARKVAIEQATIKAAEVPLETAEMAVKVMALAERCIALGNLNAISDAASGAALAQAALTSSGYNVRINVNNLHDKHSGDSLLDKLASLDRKAGVLEKEIYKSLLERGGLSFG
jgi:formiminotetrahydrofolate cyclodeaminase